MSDDTGRVWGLDEQRSRYRQLKRGVRSRLNGTGG